MQDLTVVCWCIVNALTAVAVSKYVLLLHINVCPCLLKCDGYHTCAHVQALNVLAMCPAFGERLLLCAPSYICLHNHYHLLGQSTLRASSLLMSADCARASEIMHRNNNSYSRRLDPQSASCEGLNDMRCPSNCKM